MKKPKLHYTFHNPNTPEATADFLVKLSTEVSQHKVEQKIHEAQDAALDSPSESSPATPSQQIRPAVEGLSPSLAVPFL